MTNARKRAVVYVVLLVLIVGALYQQQQDTRSAVRLACERSNDNSESINGFLDLLIANARISTLLTPAEVKQRVAGYEGQKVDLLTCH